MVELLPLLPLLGLLQVDPDTTPAAARKEVERFQTAYIKANALEPAETELAKLRTLFNKGDEEASARTREITATFTYALAANFKVQRDLFRKHGGRLVLSAFGFHVAKDAMAAEWLAWEKAGRWRFPSPEIRTAVFKTLSEMGGDGVVEGERAKEIFARPIWDPPGK
jgi:hypothetical protein